MIMIVSIASQLREFLSHTPLIREAEFNYNFEMLWEPPNKSNSIVSLKLSNWAISPAFWLCISFHKPIEGFTFFFFHQQMLSSDKFPTTTYDLILFLLSQSNMWYIYKIEFWQIFRLDSRPRIRLRVSLRLWFKIFFIKRNIKIFFFDIYIKIIKKY